jgi:acyl-CoA synthetase (AMP-forming)/AMP-acid ligase II/acyl carrier protein
MTIHGPSFHRPAEVAPTLAAFIRSRVLQNPTQRYIEADHAGAGASSGVGELHRRALQILAALRDSVDPAEADIVLCFASALDFIPAAWACIYGGYSCHPWQIAKVPGQKQEIDLRLRAIGQRLRDPILLTTTGINDGILPPDGSPFRTAIVVDRDMPGPGAARAEETPAFAQADSGKDAAFLIATSGTTEVAKFAIVKHSCLLDRFLVVPEPPRKRLVCFPFDGVTGLRIVFPGLGDCVYMQPGRLAAQPLELLKLIEEFGINGFGISPSALARILDAAEGSVQRYDLSSLKRIGTGAEMISPDVVRRAQMRFHEFAAAKLKVSFGYGMTETGVICRTRGFEIGEDIGPVPVSVGRCVPGWSLRIVDDDGRPLPPGTAGNIEVRSDVCLFDGYRNEPEQKDQSFTPDGWFRTGDRGVVADGALTVTGRQKATIIVNARKISLESIEAALRGMNGICRTLVAAAAVRREDSATDELAVFFAPSTDEPDLDGLCRRMSQEIWQRCAVPVKHFVRVSEADFPVTAVGKIRREELVRRYQSGLLQPQITARAGHAGRGRPLTETESWLIRLWGELLRLDHPPSVEDRFFELGGDSAAAAELIVAVEDKFGLELPVEAFFQQPTIAALAALVGQHATVPASRPPDRPGLGGYRLLHHLQGHIALWPGERQFADSLLVGLNRAGRRPPIFMVFQGPTEFEQLAKYLGPDQPLYGMRSCVGLMRVKDYSQDVIETVCNRYLWEILALSPDGPLVVGGNCQGGIFALAMARKLKQIGRTPSLLILMEWTYSYPPYTEPTLLLYGDRSHTAELYLNPGTRLPNWQDDFPANAVAPIPGAYGELFRDENVTGLANVIAEHLDRAQERDRGLEKKAAPARRPALTFW